MPLASIFIILLAQVGPGSIMSKMEGPSTYEQTCLSYDGSKQHYCDGKALAFCAQLNATVSIDTCTAEVKRELGEEKELAREEQATPQAAARRREFAKSPEGRFLRSRQAFYANASVRDCLIHHEDEVEVLERCKVDPRKDYALGAVDFIAKMRPAESRGVGMTIGGRSPYVTPWVNAHCRPLVAGYRCVWRGIAVEY